MSAPPPPRGAQRTVTTRASAAAAVAVAHTQELSAQCFPELPPALVAHIFALLPTTTRLHCMEVSRAWRCFLRSDPSPWLDAQLQYKASSFPLLHAASTRAGGRLHTLNIEGWRLPFDDLLSVLQRNAGSLRCLRTWLCSTAGADLSHRFFSSEHVKSLLHAAPHLTSLDCDVSSCSPDDCMRLYANPAFQPRMLCVSAWNHKRREVMDFDIPAFAAAAATRVSLSTLDVQCAPLHVEASMHALVEMAVEVKLHSLTLTSCAVEADVLCDGLADLLQRGRLQQLSIDGHNFDPGEPPGVLFPAVTPSWTRFCDALVGSCTLTLLCLSGLALWSNERVAEQILHACLRCDGLQELDLSCNNVRPDQRRTVGLGISHIMRRLHGLGTLSVGYCEQLHGGFRYGCHPPRRARFGGDHRAAAA